jgi:hypothetical protein
LKQVCNFNRRQFGKSDYLHSANNVRGPVMTAFESRIHPDFDGGFFDSVETDILCAAFERAWAFVGSDPSLEGLEVSKRQSELANCLMALEKLGETNPTSLANAAIRMLHQRHARKRFLTH